MKRGQRQDLIERMIRADEEYCDRMNKLFDDCLEAMPPDLALRGKKVICDGMARQKAEDGLAIMDLLVECPLEPEE